jgi:hypothetical protein
VVRIGCKGGEAATKSKRKGREEGREGGRAMNGPDSGKGTGSDGVLVVVHLVLLLLRC